MIKCKVCGHIKDEHTGFFDLDGNCHPEGCWATLKDHTNCLCWQYQADNLFYLEELYEKSTVK